MGNVITWILQAIGLLLATIDKHGKCPDGICDEPLSLAATVSAQVSQPQVGSRIGDIFTMLNFVRCFPMSRVVAVAGRIGKLFRECDRCPDGGCSVFDLLGCLDLTELVSIIKEIISIIQDSQMCDDGDGNVITLGQAAE
jgi:hypothetical protein